MSPSIRSGERSVKKVQILTVGLRGPGLQLVSRKVYAVPMELKLGDSNHRGLQSRQKRYLGLREISKSGKQEESSIAVVIEKVGSRGDRCD